MCRFPEMFVVEAVKRGAKVVSHPIYGEREREERDGERDG